MEFISEYGLFLLKAATIVLAILAVIGGAVNLTRQQAGKKEETLELTNLNEKYDTMHSALKQALLDPGAQKLAAKEEKKRKKAEAKKQAKEARKLAREHREPTAKKHLFVLDFDGDIKATPVDTMREEISALLTLASDNDEVLVRLQSGGGAVHAYGLAASQLQRIRDHGIPLTVAVDRVAASGGYLMACVADRIIAAPFAILGSIGVIAQIPNLNKVLKKNDIDFEQLTAGKYKRTLTIFGENTDEARQKMQEELEEVHTQFKEFVATRRPDMDIEAVATGEHWLGEKALALGLVDELRTSDDYLLSQRDEANLLHLKYVGHQTLLEKISHKMTALATRFGARSRDDDYPQLV